MTSDSQSKTPDATEREATKHQQQTEKNYFRSERTVLINSNWYFMNRETAAEGPFRTREDAEAAVERYVELVTSPLFETEEIQRINTLSL